MHQFNITIITIKYSNCILFSRLLWRPHCGIPSQLVYWQFHNETILQFSIALYQAITVLAMPNLFKKQYSPLAKSPVALHPILQYHQSPLTECENILNTYSFTAYLIAWLISKFIPRETHFPLIWVSGPLHFPLINGTGLV